jgi:hypothetical protein
MTAFSACLGLAAAGPAVSLREAGPAAWIGGGLGVTGTWSLAQALAAGNSAGRRADMVTLPVMGGVSAALMLTGIHWAAGSGAQGSASSGAAVLETQLSLVTYYAPGLYRIAVLARRSSSPPAGTRGGMRALSASAWAELVLLLGVSAITVISPSVPREALPALEAVVGFQGAAAVCGIAAVAAAPVLAFISARCALWVAYRRLHPLWAAMVQAVPDVGLPVERGSRFGIRWRLLRRIIEIRDAELALRPYWRADVAAQASAAARSASLGADLEQAAVEAAVIMDAARARMRGAPPPRGPVPAQYILTLGDGDIALKGGDLDGEVTRLSEVSRIIRSRPPGRETWQPGRSAKPSP